MSLLWRCQLSKLQADVRHKYKLSGRLVLSRGELLRLTLSTLFMLTLQSVTKCDLVYREGLDEKEPLGGLVVFPVPGFFVYRVLGVLQRCDHKLAVLTESDFETILARNIFSCQSRSRLERATVGSARPTEFM